MSNKEAIMFMVDAGKSMDDMYNENSSRLKIALECVKMTLQEKIFNNNSHEVGFCIFGDHQSDDGNSMLLQPLEKPNLELVRKIQKLCSSKFNNEIPGGDIFRAIEFLIIKIMQKCGTKKCKRRAFLFTNGMGETKYQENLIERLVQQLISVEIKLNIIPIDFMVSYDVLDNQMEPLESDSLDENQNYNAQLLMKLKQYGQQNVQIFPATIAIELYKRFRKRDVNAVALFKGEMEIAGLKIDVESYKMIRRERLKSLAKYDINMPFNQHITNSKEITTQISYIVQGDETSTSVNKENQQNAYHYGPHLIPISEILQKNTKVYEEKNLKILGFVDKVKIPRECLMGEVEIVVPSNHCSSDEKKKLFTALIYSMMALHKYAIARYVPRNSKGGVQPRLVVLIPYRSSETEKFYLIELPTVEDVRDYPFNPLKKATERQTDIVKRLIDQMQLYKKNDEEEIEQLKVENIFNPTRQYFYQVIFHRAFSEDDEIPDLEDNIKKYLNPENAKFDGTEELMKEVKKEFKLVRKELPKDKVATKKPTRVWVDIIDEQLQPQIPNMDLENEEAMLEQMKPLKGIGQSEDRDDVFDPSKPVLSFNRMINNSKIDLVDQALKQFTAFIHSRCQSVLNEENLRLIVDCVSNLRRGCLEQQEAAYFDDWFEKLPSVVEEKVFKKLKSEGIGFLERSNKEIYRVTELTKVDIQELDELD